MKHRVAVAGASGFVGQALVTALLPAHDVIALGRGGPAPAPREGLSFRRCDLYSAEQAAEALAGATAAVYLVHSMLPSARLVQAAFSDLDVICADNFARAAARARVPHIVYLGGLTPASADGLSEHLRSREEVERVLASHGARVTTLRAGIVIGPGGSSFDMLLRLAERLPWMILPKWGSTRSQPIGLDDVVRLLVFALEHPEFAGRAHDVGGPSVLSYAQMLEHTVTLLGRRPHVLRLPFNVPLFSLLWVSAITGAPLALVMPLIESLKHEMLARQGLELQAASGLCASSFDILVAQAMRDEAARVEPPPSPQRDAAARKRPSTVVSLQRLHRPGALTARAVADTYFHWLPRWLRPFIWVTRTASGWSLGLVGVASPLLELSLDEARSDDDRAVFRISGGLLRAGASEQGTFEFRSVLAGQFVMTLVSDFEPRLPWLLYKFTQAIAHGQVMRAFGRYLNRTRARPGSTAPLPHDPLFLEASPKIRSGDQPTP